MFKFLTKEYWKKKLNDKKGLCLVFPIIPECELVDKKSYTCYSSNLSNEYSGKYREKHFWLQWDAKNKVFIEENLKYRKPTEIKLYSYGEVYPIFEGFRDRNSFILEYDPSRINAFDLKELSDICFNLSDENTQSDEIWDKLITYFEDRGIE